MAKPMLMQYHAQGDAVIERMKNRAVPASLKGPLSCFNRCTRVISRQPGPWMTLTLRAMALCNKWLTRTRYSTTAWSCWRRRQVGAGRWESAIAAQCVHSFFRQCTFRDCIQKEGG